jgi:hypothetical protein
MNIAGHGRNGFDVFLNGISAGHHEESHQYNESYVVSYQLSIIAGAFAFVALHLSSVAVEKVVTFRLQGASQY